MSVPYKNFDDDGNLSLSDGEYILDDDGFICSSKSQKEVPLVQDDRESILDTIRSIQEGNPNIEAVFIEESEENETSVSSHSKTIKNPSALSAVSRCNGKEISGMEWQEAENNISEDTSSASEAEYYQSTPKTASAKPVTPVGANQMVGKASATPKAPPALTKPVTPADANQMVRKASVTPNATPKSNASTLSTPSQKLPPLRVKEVSSSSLTSKFMKYSNTIVLNNPNSSGKQILVIPDEVLPLITSSLHPITLNVPGVGAVVINKSKTSVPQPQPVNRPQSEPVKKVPDESTYSPLCDPKYQFWRYRKYIKRDLDGYSINDRLGFYKAEQVRSKMCMTYYENNIKRMKCEIETLSRKFGLLPKPPPKPVKTEKVNKTKETRKRTIKEVKDDNLTPIQKKNLHVIKRWKEHFERKTESLPESSSSEDDESLLVRKKRLEREKKRKVTKQKIKRKRVSNKKLSPHENPYLKKYNTYQSTCKIIKNLAAFELEISPDKPILVINEENYLSTDFEKMKLKNNLVYPTATEEDIPKVLVNNAALYNLWFVEPKIFQKYLALRNQMNQ